MRRTRVVLAEMSRILSHIVREAVADEGDMEVVGELPDSSTLPLGSGTDVIVMGRELVAADVGLLCRCPGVAILALTEDGRRAFHYHLHPERIAVNGKEADLSAQLLVDAIRAAARRSSLNGGV